MADILPWLPSETAGEVIRHLVEGHCVCLPTESTYEVVASALRPDAIARLPSNLPPALAIFDYAELWDWLPRLRGAGPRLFRKLGAAPVVLRADCGFANGLWARLPVETRRAVAPDGRLAIRWPSHPMWSELRQAGVPLVSVSVPEAVNAETAMQRLGPAVACIVDGGPAQSDGAPSVVRLEGRRCIVERVGVFSQEDIDEVTLCRTLFICTGNTCRSPMAAAICGKLLSDQFGCTLAELKSHGFLMQSAGLAAMMGAAASADAVTVAAALGADLSQHRSGMVTMEMLLWADYVLAMTSSHCYTLESILPEGMLPPRVLSPHYEDIADPIGGELADYRTCAAQILDCLRARLPELLEA